MLTLALFVAAAGLLTSCNPETVLGRNLEGDWNITSFSEDGTELIGNLLTSAEFEFGEYDGDEGSFKLTIVDFTGGTSVAQGDYELNADGDEVELIYTDGSKETYDVTVDGNEMEMVGVIDGFRYEIRGEM